MKQVIVLGGVSYNTMIYLDRHPQPFPHPIFDCEFHETVGSTGAGKALNLAKLGMDVTLHGVVGDDHYGRTIVDYLNTGQVTVLSDIDPLGTQRQVNLMNREGQRISIYIAPGTFDPIINYLQVTACLPKFDYIVLNIINYCRHFIPAIKAQKKLIWCDLHDYDGYNEYHQDFIQAADYLFLSSEALPNYRAFMQSMIDNGKKLVVCTHAHHGSTVLTAAGEWIEMPIISTYQLKDSNGAGDSFFAGFLYGHAHGATVEQCMKFGTIVSGLSITSKELALPTLSPSLVAAEYLRIYEESLAQ